MRTRLIPCICLLLAVSAPLVFAEEPPRTISVTGTSVTKAPPDIISWRITSTDLDKVLLPAVESSESKLRAIMGILNDLGVEPKDTQTGTLRISKEYDRDEHGNRTIFKHFQVRRQITAKQRDMSRFNEFLERLVQAAEVEVSYSLEASDVHTLRYENRLKAVKIAKQKAEDMLEILGAKLGKVLVVAEHPPASGRSAGFSNIVNYQQEMYFDRGSLEDDSITGTFAPGAIDIRTTVYMTFAIK